MIEESINRYEDLLGRMGQAQSHEELETYTGQIRQTLQDIQHYAEQLPDKQEARRWHKLGGAWTVTAETVMDRRLKILERKRVAAYE